MRGRVPLPLALGSGGSGRRLGARSAAYAAPTLGASLSPPSSISYPLCLSLSVFSLLLFSFLHRYTLPCQNQFGFDFPLPCFWVLIARLSKPDLGCAWRFLWIARARTSRQVKKQGWRKRKPRPWYRPSPRPGFQIFGKSSLFHRLG